MKPGCYTALVTPFEPDAARIDTAGLRRLIQFQIQNGITGILAVGTTGESPTLSWEEHEAVVDEVARETRGRCLCIAGAGSNNTREALKATAHAQHCGVSAVLLVDPYYNGPSSLEIRREYVEPIARSAPDLQIIPYVIPGRTGTQLMPEDLALLYRDCPNVASVKEATGSLENMRRTRQCCGADYTIFSGDDPMTVDMMTDPAINAAGVISVASNLAPAAVTRMVSCLRSGDRAGAAALNQALKPLFDLVTVKTTETSPHGEVVCRARNPLAFKTLMALLGLPAGPCRPPMGKMTRKGFEFVIAAARTLLSKNPEILQPAADFFGIDIADRLDNPEYREGLFYESY